MYINPSNRNNRNRNISSLGHSFNNITIHNDENATPIVNKNRNSNRYSSIKSTHVGVHKTNPKTPSNNKPRKAFGDISNRNKQFQTPHKYNGGDPIKIFNPSSTTAKKIINKKTEKIVKFKSTTKNTTKLKQKQKKSFRNEEPIDNVEMPAGRLWIEEQELIADDDDISEASLNCKTILEDCKAIQEMGMEACRKDWERYAEKCESEYDERMKMFEEQTRFEGLGNDCMRSFVESIEMNLIDNDIAGIYGVDNEFNESFQCANDDNISI